VEASEFRDAAAEFEKKGAVILGISPDSPKAQAGFKSKYGLPFTLLCDTEKSIAQAYSVLKEKNMYGKKVIGIERSTFVIGEDGRILKIFAGVKAKGHAQEVLESI
jgi:peroxiredoxin Q/BCP